MVICGLSCMFTPFATFLYTGYFFGAMLFVYGIAGIVRAIVRKDMPTLGVVTSVLALIVGFISIIRPGTMLAFDGMVLYLIAAWFVFQGVMSIVIALQNKSAGASGWFWGVLVGILGIILGLYLCGHPFLAAISVGMLIGFSFVQSGCNMIVFALTSGN